MPAHGERPCGEHVVAVSDDGDSQGGQEQRLHVRPGQIRHGRHRKPVRHRAHYGDPVRLQPEHGDGRGRERHGEQRSGQAWESGLGNEQEDQDAE